MIDGTTGFTHAVAVRKVPARVLKDFFCNFRYPHRIRTDRASYFTSKVIKDFVRTVGVQHSVSSPYHPQSQGAVERSNQTMKSILRKYALEFNTNWDEELPYLLFVLRDMPPKSTGFTPYELLSDHDTRG